MQDQTESPLLPPAFLFRYTLPVLPAPGLPGTGANRVRLRGEHRLAALSGITGEPDWMQLSMGWNDQGLGLVAEVSKPPAKLRPRPATPPVHLPLQWRLMFDLRDTKSIHRANRFCLHFTLQVGRPGAWDEAQMQQLPIDRAREPAPTVDVAKIHHRVQEVGGELRVELWFPRAALPGFDPAEHRRIGFNSDFEDERWGRQSLCLNHAFPTIYDPSLWQSLELQGEAGDTVRPDGGQSPGSKRRPGKRTNPPAS